MSWGSHTVGLIAQLILVRAIDDKGESAEAQAAPQLLALEDKPRVETLELADAAAPAHAAGRRLLISFPESEAYLEKLRREALIIGCC